MEGSILKYFQRIPRHNDSKEKENINIKNINEDTKNSPSIEVIKAPVNGIQDNKLHSSAYELKRQMNITKNQEFLKQLGIKKMNQCHLNQLVHKNTQLSRKKRVKSSAKSLSEVPLRRSKRLRPLAKDDIHTMETAPIEEIESIEEDIYNESNVLQYTCSIEKADNIASIENQFSIVKDKDPSFVGGFIYNAQARGMSDRQLSRCYSLHFSPFNRNGVIASGGHGGHVAIYRNPSRSSKILPTEDHPIEDYSPLLSFKAHSGWVSSVNLTLSVPGGIRNLLVTTSNDATLKIWDLNQVSSLKDAPKELYQSNSNLHTKGIFGLDIYENSILTCSKDSSIVLSSVRSDSNGVSINQRYEDHDGVVKSVAFAPLSKGQQFISGGNDRCIRLYDTRQNSNPTLVIPDAYSRAINSVQYHPSDSNLILSSSFDPQFYIHDIRKSNEPLVTFTGHVSNEGQKKIYVPIFIENGKSIAVAGTHKQHLISLYRSMNGIPISRGVIHANVETIASDPFNDRLLVATGHVLQFYDYQYTKRA